MAAQVAGLLQARGVSVQDAVLRETTRQAGSHVEHGFEASLQAWREYQIARGQRRRYGTRKVTLSADVHFFPMQYR